VTFDPDWTIAPGETVREWLAENGLSVRVAARACGLDVDVLERLLVGDEPLTEDIAHRLKALTLVPASFWLNAERRYRRDLELGRIDTTLRET
jgi:HTH-type transcriptional regulator/antitoxin HigA